MYESRNLSVDAAFQSWLAAHASRQMKMMPLTLVQLSDEELKENPWSPVEASLFVHAALSFTPRVVAIAPVPDWPDADTSQLELLHNQLLRTPKGLLGAELGFPEDTVVLPPMQAVPVLRNVIGSASRLPEFPIIARQPPEELRLAVTLGFFEPVNMSTRTSPNRAPLVFRYRGFVVPSFALQAAMLWYGVTPGEVAVVPGSHIALGKTLRIPVDAAGTMAVDFAVPFTRMTLGDLMLAAEQSSEVVVSLKDGIALLARTDAAVRTLPLAGGRLGSRDEWTAAAIATLQAGQFPRRAGVPVEAALIVGIGALGWLRWRRGTLQTAVLGAGVFTAYLLLALGVFALWLVVLPLLLPAGLMLFMILFRWLA